MTNLAQTSDTYRKQSELLSELLSKMRATLDSHPWEIGLSTAEIDSLDLRNRNYRRATCDPHYRVALAGGFSTGKSELLNAFLGQSVLPAQISDTTFVPTVVRASKNGQRTNTIRFITQEEVTGILEDYGNRGAGPGWPLTFTRLQQISEVKLKEETQTLASKSNMSSREMEDLQNFLTAVRTPSLQEYVRSQHCLETQISESDVQRLVVRRSDRLERYLASSIIVNMPDFPFSEEVEIIDLPGTDAGDRWAKQTTHRYVRDVDMMLLVVKADAVFNDAAEDLFSEIKDWVGGHTERLFVIINKADLYAGYEPSNVLGAYNQLLEGIRSSVPEYQPNLIYVSAAAALPTCEPHASAIEAIQNIKVTGNSELDRLLAEVRKQGGVDGARKVISDFLVGPAFRVKQNKMQVSWENLLSLIPSKVVADFSNASRWLASDRDNLSGRCNEILKSCDAKIKTNGDQLCQQTRQICESLDSNVFKKWADELHATASQVVSNRARQNNRAREAASSTSDDEWLVINSDVRMVVERSIDDFLMRFSDAWKAAFSNPTATMRLFFESSKASNSWFPTDPFNQLRESIKLLAFVVFPPVSKDVRPFPQPIHNAVFGSESDAQSYCSRFYKSVEDYVGRRCDSIVTEIRTVLPLHATWHIERFTRDSKTFLQNAIILVSSTPKETAGKEAKFDFGNFLKSGTEPSTIRFYEQLEQMSRIYKKLSSNPLD